MMPPRLTIGLLCGLALLLAEGCAERTPVRTFPELQDRVKRGATIYVIDDTGSETRGTLIDLSPAALTLAVHGVERRLDEEAIRQVQTYGDPLWNGLLIGAAVALPGAFIADPTYDPCPDNPQRQCANSQVGQRMLTIGLSAAAGAGIDALIRGRHQVYLSSSQGAASGSRATIAPHIGASSASVVVTVRVP